ncbi:hypothetical protein [Blastochloris viridis]|uniref:Uncharacterized protein n=1 Tax=Blastochloris viridis TaxID=1079 RepID=A0A0P0JB72_BLAVI|nr:hypothetical protein [Blastochloris viridis]ALK09200.1 hypothetical protein BVIR_1415 [Blastochloris viridis]CUU41863.1 hypothetical protein BVIRIDIS_08600 [Blastochloris viridis]
MHQAATIFGRRAPLIAAALLYASLAYGQAEPPVASPPTASPPGFGMVPPAEAPLAGGPPAPGEPAPPRESQPRPIKPPDFSWEALGDASKRFWGRVFDPKALESQPLDPALTRTPGTVVREMTSCPSSSGVPDCDRAAKTACTAKGFADGRPLDTQSKRTCPPEVTIGLRKGEPGECRLDYMVSSSVCW